MKPAFFLLAVVLCALRPAPVASVIVHWINDQSQFPEPGGRARTPEYRGYDSARNATVTYTRNGAMRLLIEHGFLPNVTSDDIAWFWENLSATSSWTNENDTIVDLQNYLIFHTVDHIEFNTNTPGSVIPGNTTFNFVEFLLSYCTRNGTDRVSPNQRRVNFACPEPWEGFDTETPKKIWYNWPQNNQTLKVLEFETNGSAGSITFAFDVLGLFNAATITHSWVNDDVEGVLGTYLTTNVLVGIDSAQGRRTARIPFRRTARQPRIAEAEPEAETANILSDITGLLQGFPLSGGLLSGLGGFGGCRIIGNLLTGTVNNLAILGFCNGEERNQCAWRNILHYIEEYGNMALFLPQIAPAN